MKTYHKFYNLQIQTIDNDLNILRHTYQILANLDVSKIQLNCDIISLKLLILFLSDLYAEDQKKL